MNFPLYTMDTVAGPHSLIYGYSRQYRKWGFRVGKNIFLFPCHGQEQGHKIANIIAGSWKRSGKLDGLARANIDRVVKG